MTRQGGAPELHEVAMRAAVGVAQRAAATAPGDGAVTIIDYPEGYARNMKLTAKLGVPVSPI